MGGSMTSEPIYEDDNISIRTVQPDQYIEKDAIATIEITAAQLEHWEDTSSHPGMAVELGVNLTTHQWAGVLSMLRTLMAFTPEPGIIRLAHDDIYAQIKEAHGFDG